MDNVVESCGYDSNQHVSNLRCLTFMCQSVSHLILMMQGQLEMKHFMKGSRYVSLADGLAFDYNLGTFCRVRNETILNKQVRSAHQLYLNCVVIC